jgi:hypothetical protein
MFALDIQGWYIVENFHPAQKPKIELTNKMIKKGARTY